MNTINVENAEISAKSSFVEGETFGLSSSVISTQVRFLQGEILTLIEAVVDDKERRDATKEIIKATFNRKINWMNELAYGAYGCKVIEKTIPADKPVGEIVS